MLVMDMIKNHPQVGDDFTEELGVAVRHAMYCAEICASCADACLAESTAKDMRQCIRNCLDCSDICEATAKTGLRRTAQNIVVLRAQLQACILACEACAEECEKHDNQHCNRCGKMCRECTSDCRQALPEVN
ncbi:four-helix bundle copper-binding protein [Marinicaulis aureus]|uniref:Four-helix bundle copper-binding protein n=1 Tax=Hyphococcus aureus TaxID=2666033 RepID=A0ABW1KW52_9PROT